MNYFIFANILFALFSNSASAQSVDVGAAATGALITLAIRGVIAFCLFKLITTSLTRKTLYTPIDNARWVGAWLMGVSVLTNPSLNKSDLDFYIGSVVLAIVWFLIGFVIGFLWRKVKPLTPASNQKSSAPIDDEKLWEEALAELNSPNKNEGLWAKCFSEANGDEAKARAQYLSLKVAKLKQVDTNITSAVKNEAVSNSSPLNNPLIYVFALVVIVGGFFLVNSKGSFTTKKTKDIVFGVYTCKDIQSSSDNCERASKQTARITPIKESNKVIFEFTNLATKKIQSIDRDCNVVDDRNWICVGSDSSNALDSNTMITTTGGAIEMKDGVITATGITITSRYNGKLSNQSYIPATKFLPQ